MEVALSHRMANFIRRVYGALALDALTYEEIEGDYSANGQALTVVLLSALAAGLGARGFGATLSVVPTIAAIALIAWLAWALLTFEIGARLLRTADTRGDVSELLRTIGFASAPGMLRVFGALPALATAAFAVSAIWMLAAMIVAVRQALDYRSTARAIAVCAIGWTLTVLLVLASGWMTPAVSTGRP